MDGEEALAELVPADRLAGGGPVRELADPHELVGGSLVPGAQDGAFAKRRDELEIRVHGVKTLSQRNLGPESGRLVEEVHLGGSDRARHRPDPCDP